MPEILDHVAYLSQEIGPRPAGTEEEQQAALYITEQIQRDAGLPAVIEDFSGAGSADLPRAICCAVTFVVAVLALIVPVLVIPATILSLLAVALVVAEVFDRPILSKVFARGVSQNVVAKYEPGYLAETGGSRRRKIIVVARYDSGKVRDELKPPFITALPVLRWANLGAMALVTLMLLLRATLFLHIEGAGLVFFSVVIGIALLLVILPVIGFVAHRFAAYNEAANCNASGVAVLLDVARRVGRGRVSEAELAAREAAIHGEEAARAAGLVPEGAELVYAASGVKPPEIAPQSEAERLAAAKAAVAALTGKPVSSHEPTDLAEKLVQIKEPPLPSPTDDEFQAQRDETREAFTTIPPETIQAALANAEAATQGSDAALEGAAAGAVAAPATVAAAAAAGVSSLASAVSSAKDDVPDWFKKAQEKAKKPADEDQNIQRSRYADALEAALAENANQAEEAKAGEKSEIEMRLQSVRDGIMEVKAPQIARAADEQAAEDASAEGTEAASAATSDEAAAPASPSDAQPAASSDEAAETLVPEIRFESPESTQATEEAGATCAMPPIDVSELRLDDMPPMEDISMPSFLDPRKAQAEKLEERGEEHRTSNRVDVTAAPIGDSGRIEQLPLDVDSAATDTADASQAEAQPAETEASPVAHRRPIVLPDIGVSAANPAPITELPKQRAPLADVESAGKTAAKSLLTMLPSIDPVAESTEASPSTEDEASAATPQRADLRASLPSLSGAIPRQEDAAVSAAGSFTAAAGATGAFAPVGDELLENVDPDDIYVEDADDSSYEEDYTETGAFAGPGYVDMPKSRAHRLFDKLFGRHKEEKEPSPQEWLDVDDSFDARSVGAARGGWESFRSEQESAQDYDGDTFEADSFEEDVAYGAEAPTEAIDPVYQDDDFSTDGEPSYEDGAPRSGGGRRWNGGGFSRLSMGRTNDAIPDEAAKEDEIPVIPDGNMETPPELKDVYQFRNPDINTEVWFVALGSELAEHGGIRAFIAEHSQDLKGSIIIDLDALGAGDLCMTDREGMFRKAKISSRMKRYTKKASQATGLSIGTTSILWDDSAASVAIKQGLQAMHLVGMDGEKPAFFAQGDDVLENIDEETLNNNAEFVMELLKNI